MKHYYVGKNGNDSYGGSKERPFLTIQRAANVAIPGDVITVGEGIYREAVDPKQGGLSDTERITYEAEKGAKVVISGAEQIKEWTHVEGTIYKTVLSNIMFKEFNPYKEVVSGDWFEPKGKVSHLGEVYINGKSMFEVESLEEVKKSEPLKTALDKEWSTHTWYCETTEQTTTIYANFKEFLPEQNIIEISVRKHCFWPKQTGINYITVRGFHLTCAAPNWAPPTALQEGLIGPHWSKGWIIEENEISNSKNSGISLGKEITSGHNEWTLLGTKNGTQRERDVIFNAYRMGWNKENIGSHIVRNNVIHDCEQTGICGHLGEVFSEIYGNHIYDIHVKRMYGGAEIAGIKLHAAIDCHIHHNHIHNCDRGMWMDWQAQGVRISGNLYYENDTEDLFIEVSHGPYVVDNNVFLSMKNVRDMSQGGAYINNLFSGFFVWQIVANRFTPYHYAHETGIHGLMTILGGDNRFYNNIFTGTQENMIEKEKEIEIVDWVHMGVTWDEFGIVPKGLAIYDSCPIAEEEWYQKLHTVDEFAMTKLPMYCGSNLYFGDAKPFRSETNSKVFADRKAKVSIQKEADGVYLECDFGDAIDQVETILVTTKLLGMAFESELPYENADGSPLCIEEDFFGNTRPYGAIQVGPFEGITTKNVRIKVAKIY